MYRASQPVREMRRPDAWIVAWREALIVHRDAVIERLWIGDYRPCVPFFAQELPNELVLTDRVGTGYLDHAVQWLGECHIGHDGRDVIRCDGLHQNRWDPDRLPFGRPFGDAIHKLKELRGMHDGVGNRRSLDQIFLGHLRSEVTAGEQ